jgi:chromosomal replication initiator protein
MPFAWPKAVDSLKTVLGNETVDRWIAPLRPITISDDLLILEAPNQFFRDFVVGHYQQRLEEVGGRRVRVIIPDATATPSTLSRAEFRLPKRQDQPTDPPPPESRSGLNTKFTFEQFVVGPSNRFAHAASMAIAESPAKAYNPLFIYGGVGLGKTHLMHAIGHAILKRSSSARVCYISSEQFTNELITSIQTKTTAKFRDRYRTVGALLVDDIQFIAGKESTQEEFFHTFNSLYDDHKQIVISSDRSPKEIAGLEERLVSRFEWGLVTDIQPPDLETRIAILRKKAEDAGIQVPAPVIEFIARQISSNIRELEGALIRVVAYCRFCGKPLSVDIAQEVLKEMVKEVESRITLELIQRKVSEYFNVTPEVLRSPRRQQSILYPRQVAMYLCRTLTDASLPEIGQAFGGRDHSTVMHAVDKIGREIAQDTHKKRVVDLLSQTIVTPSR